MAKINFDPEKCVHCGLARRFALRPRSGLETTGAPLSTTKTTVRTVAVASRPAPCGRFRSTRPSGGCMPEPRFYRELMAAAGLCSFNVTEGESDLQIAAESDLTAEARRALRYYRQQLTEQIRRQPAFRHSLVPVEPLAG